MFARAGNIGTNHLFEPIVLDRLMAMSLGWWAIALAVEAPSRFVGTSCPLLGLAALIHPSVGLQLSAILGVGWVVWRLSGTGPKIGRRSMAWGATALGLALLPGLATNLGQPGRLLEGLSPEDFRLLSVELQSPQHMLPDLWRMPQWLAWFCYPVLAGVTRIGVDRSSRAVGVERLVVLILVNLAFLLVAYIGIEVVQNLKLTVFQPFRMATLARGLCLILIAGHCKRLRTSERGFNRLRVLWISVGLLNDWSMVVVTISESVFAIADSVSNSSRSRRLRVVGLLVFAAGLGFLSRHDTESGHLALIGATAGAMIVSRVLSRRGSSELRVSRGRQIRWLAAAWLIPIAALSVGLVDPDGRSPVTEWLVKRCRFGRVPNDDMERLAAWCRDNTPVDSRFIGPPGPKSFRVWSERSLAFNRASSPYHAAGLDDWSKRFMAHVGFEGSRSDFVRAYLRNRQALERGFDRMTEDQLSRLAERNGAEFILAASPSPSKEREKGALEVVHVEGRYAVYRASPTQMGTREGRGPMLRR